MSKLIPLEFNNQRIIPTKVLAELYGTEEQNIQKNYKRNEVRFIEGKHFYKLEGEALKKFKSSLPTESTEPYKFAPVLYLWTERGVARHAKILETDEAWEVYEALEESYFRKQTLPAMSKELQAIFMLDQKQIEIDNRVTKLENTMTIDYSQQEVINRTAKERLVQVLGGKDTPAYRELSKKVFSNLWKRYKQVFHVASYKDTAKKDYEEAIKYIEKWEPSKELGYMITGANSQIQFNN